MTFTTSGSLGEVESGGPVMNIVPKSGGNTLSGGIFTTWETVLCRAATTPTN